ncbi:MAG: aminodeoxychorismate/anthranilate synthase component II [Pseudomonadota bacterium]
MILIIDNYDSFTYNLVHLIGQQCPDLVVKRNDVLTVDEVFDLSPTAIILSPGPCTPTDAGICVEVAQAAKAKRLPLLGVCLGHQSIVQAAGGTIIRARRLMHGRTSDVCHQNETIFNNIPSPFTATRYHSLVAQREGLPEDIHILAEAEDDGEIMACRWGDAPIWGVQFHPESIASQYGETMIANFLNTAGLGRQAA